MRIRQYVYFALFSQRISAEEIATWLGIAPDEITIRGSRRTAPAIPVSHSWKIVCREPGLSVDEQISRVLDRLRPHTDRIAELAERLRAENEEHAGAVLEVVRYLNDDEEDPQLNPSDTRPPAPPDEPNLLGWHLDRDVLDFLTATGAALDIDEYDLTPDEPEPTQVQIERDALRRELGDLRAWLSRKLDVLRREPGPQEITVLSVPSDREILAEIERLRVEVAALRQPEDAPDRRWLEIDELILARTNIQALQQIRTLFECTLHEAVGLLDERYQTLRHQRPNGFTEDSHEQERHPLLPSPDRQQADKTDSDNGLA
ncbi:DUF4279 domain-containing protein [Streptosporangium sp. NBC_01755]|uniref:DUF4279 domain-containing protein n=1 Tax=unclassified Streptosporangium TaxID=2632669 RepID=UPI002DD9A5C2|nr:MULTISPECIES: DUF4279 domain-containing protein [unclassified Streptosporangium]WSA27320.1 DUF4279 domain-containing protein [Streptosporangium sp. NBC_01810]WSD01128.1 DUF4279 domain-containing protein [Streptosporangium sp. NBC_01755]